MAAINPATLYPKCCELENFLKSIEHARQSKIYSMHPFFNSNISSKYKLTDAQVNRNITSLSTVLHH